MNKLAIYEAKMDLPFNVKKGDIIFKASSLDSYRNLNDMNNKVPYLPENESNFFLLSKSKLEVYVANADLPFGIKIKSLLTYVPGSENMLTEKGVSVPIKPKDEKSFFTKIS